MAWVAEQTLIDDDGEAAGEWVSHAKEDGEIEFERREDVFATLGGHGI